MICSYSMLGSETKVLSDVDMAYQDAPMKTMIYVQIETTEKAQIKKYTRWVSEWQKGLRI